MPSFADAKTQPIEWLVQDLFPQRTVSLVTAPTGMGKSVLMQHLALSVLSGRPWFGLPVKQGPVAYWDQDNPDHILTGNRIKAIAAGLDLEIPRTPESWLFRTRERINKAFDGILNRVKEMGAVLLVIDTFAAVNPYNENDNTLISQVVVDYLFPFALEGVTVIALHHPAKEVLLATPKQLKAYQRQGPNASRGATGLPAACGTVFNLVHDEHGRVTLVNAKPRYGKPPAISTLYDEDGELGSPDWRITIRPAKPLASLESAVSFIRSLMPEVRASMSSRYLVQLMTEQGYFMSQSTAARAIKECLS